MRRLVLALVLSSLATTPALVACGRPAEGEPAAPVARADELMEIASWIDAARWQDHFKQRYPEHYVASSPNDAEPRAWPDGFSPASDPVYAHNLIELEGIAPLAVLDLLLKGRADLYYENAGPALDCATRQPVPLELGRAYCWSTFGTEQRLTVTELSRGPRDVVIAWRGGSLGIEVYHRWMIVNLGTSTRIVTEECERGSLPSLLLYRSRMNPALHAAHEVWLHGIAATLGARRGAGEAATGAEERMENE